MTAARIWAAAALVLGALAYRPLLATALALPTASRFESWLFRPSQLPAISVLGVAGWLCWRRRAQLQSLPPTRHRAVTVVLAAAAAAVFVWALLTRSTDLLLASLAANLLALGAAARGAAGVRALWVPAFVLVLGVSIPLPLRNEIVWALQRATAAGAAWLLALIGQEFSREGVILRSADHAFHVIDGCSGLQGIATLTLIAVAVRELLAPSVRRAWLLVAIAPVLGYALNVVRIATVAASRDPEQYAGLQGDHTPQGLAVLAIGTVLLYGLGRLFAPHPPAGAAPPGGGAALPWRRAALWLAALATLSIALPPFPAARLSPRSPPPFPESRARWRGEPVIGDPLFLPAPPGTLYRRYYLLGTPPPLWFVDVLVATEPRGEIDASTLFSSKLAWPAPEWQLESRTTARVWLLDRDTTLAVAARGAGEDRALIYAWRPRDEGLWHESLRALLALEASPFRRVTPRAAVRLVAFASVDTERALAGAKQRLDDFIADFHDELAGL